MRFVAARLLAEKGLLFRLASSAIGRTLSALSVILLVREFLSRAVGSSQGSGAADAALLGAYSSLWIAAGLLFAAYVTGSLFTLMFNVTQQRIVKVIELDLMNRLVGHLLTLSVPFFDRHSPGDLVEAVRQDVTRLRHVLMSLAVVGFEGMMAPGIVLTLIYLDPWLTTYGLVLVPLALLPIYLLGRHALAHSYDVRKVRYRIFDNLMQLVSGVRVIKAYRAEPFVRSISARMGEQYFNELIRFVRIRSASQLAFESIGGLGLVVVVVAGGIRVMEGTLDWPTLLAFLMGLRALHRPIDRLNQAYMQMQAEWASLDRVEVLWKERPEIVQDPDAQPFHEPLQSIAFTSVDFGYDGRSVLTDISFSLKAGETVAIVGPSGAGKSTLVSLLVRYYDPTRGTVLINERDLRNLRLDDLYDLIAVVPQDVFLFAASIRENIRVARPDAPDSEVEDAARKACIHDDIVASPNGYDTPVGIGGIRLSGGQMQRVAIARAILKRAPILILDEATSSLDSIVERRFHDSIGEALAGLTCIVVAHRLFTVRHVDRVLVLDDGRLVAQGTHEGLLKESGLYRRLWETQQTERIRWDQDATGAERTEAEQE